MQMYKTAMIYMEKLKIFEEYGTPWFPSPAASPFTLSLYATFTF